jgi:hypothetical protein
MMAFLLQYRGLTGFLSSPATNQPVNQSQLTVQPKKITIYEKKITSLQNQYFQY